MPPDELRKVSRLGKWLQHAVVSACILTMAATTALLVVVLSVKGHVDSVARDDLKRTIEQNAEARVAGCEQYNAQQEIVKAGDKAEIRIVVAALVPHPSPAQQVRIDAFYRRYNHVVEITHPARDCSPAGIAKYLQQP